MFWRFAQTCPVRRRGISDKHGRNLGDVTVASDAQAPSATLGLNAVTHNVLRPMSCVDGSEIASNFCDLFPRSDTVLCPAY